MSLLAGRKLPTKYLSTNACPFFWLTENSRRSVGFVTYFHPDHQHHVESNMYHKSQGKKANLLTRLGADKNSLSLKNFIFFVLIQHRTTRYFPVQLHVPPPSMSNIFFVAMRIENYSFLSPQNFPHTTRNVRVANGTFNTRNEIIIHNFNSFHFFFSLFHSLPITPFLLHHIIHFRYGIKSTSRFKRTKSGRKSDWRDGHGVKSAFNFPYEKSLFDGSETRTALDV